jgi:hypothetical protein
MAKRPPLQGTLYRGIAEADDFGCTPLMPDDGSFLLDGGK